MVGVMVGWMYYGGTKEFGRGEGCRVDHKLLWKIVHAL